VSLLGERVVTLLGKSSPAAEQIAGWSADFIELAGPWLRDLGANTRVEKEALTALTEHGLINSDSCLSDLGRNLLYQLRETQWQATDAQFHETLAAASLGPAATVLDVGCGAGQTLRVLEPYSPAERIGIDVDLDALVFGSRVAGIQGQEIAFGHATAYSLPFRDGQFSHVLCRVALNYMHQRRALSEMVRVLRPGGYLYCRFERIWFDLGRLGRARGGREVLCRLRDLGLGASHALVGWQPVPGTRGGGGRAFGSVRCLSTMLRRSQCNVVRVEENRNCPRYLGRANQMTILARRMAC
jgi:SAM-dependent methyltransferase